MLKRIFGAILAYSKRMLVGLLTSFVSVGTKIVEYAKSGASAVTDGTKWVAEKVKESPIPELSKVAIARAMLLFIGGLVCCFLFPDEAKGDLTWFDKMLTSALDWSGTLMRGAKTHIVDWLASFRKRGECEVT